MLPNQTSDTECNSYTAQPLRSQRTKMHVLAVYYWHIKENTLKQIANIIQKY